MAKKDKSSFPILETLFLTAAVSRLLREKKFATFDAILLIKLASRMEANDLSTTFFPGEELGHFGRTIMGERYRFVPRIEHLMASGFIREKQDGGGEPGVVLTGSGLKTVESLLVEIGEHCKAVLSVP